MRRKILFTSAQRLVPDGEVLVDVVFMWRRHPRLLAYCVAAAAALFVIALVGGLESNVDRVGLAIAAAAVTGMATTDYRVLAQTTTGLHLLRASKIRQVAVEGLDTYPPGVVIERVAGNLVFTDWLVDGVSFTVPKSSEPSMTRLAAEPRPGSER